jgi:autotransporter-associated beta strand protein
MKFKSSLRAFLFGSSLFATNSLQAINYWWDIDGASTTSTAATGTWSTGSSANWTTVLAGNIATSAVTTTNADDLTMYATGMTAGTITLSGTQAANSITFNTATTIASSGGLDLGSASGGSGLFFANVANTINAPITLNSAATSVSVINRGNQAQTLSSTSTISGSGGGSQTLIIGGTGASGGTTTFSGIIGNGSATSVSTVINALATTNFSAANTYTGSTSIFAGTLSINNVGTFNNTSAINLYSTGRLTVNAANASLAKLRTAGGGTGVTAGSFLRYSTAQTTAGSGNGPGTIFGTVELNLSNVNPNYTIDLGTGGSINNVISANYASPITLSGNAAIEASPAVTTHTATYATTAGISASTSGSKTLFLIGTNTTNNTIFSAISNGSGSIGVVKGGGGTWVLSGTNTYTGGTLISGGTLQFNNQTALYNAGTAATWTNTNIKVEDGATMAFRVGTAPEFTTTEINALLGLSTAANNGFMSGANLGIDTTSGLFVYNSVIANPNSGSNVLGLTKLGSNTLILDKDNTYTGRTLISAGTLQIGDAGTTGKLSPSSRILNNGNLTILRSDDVVQGVDFSSEPIVGSGSFTQAGSGTTTLNAANTFTGTTIVTDGVLNLANPLALQNSALVTTGIGTVTFTGFTAAAFGGLSGGVDLESVIPGFTGTPSLVLNTTGNFTYGGVISNGSGGMTLTKNGTGTQVLSGANTYTGATTVNNGTLTVGSGSSGSIDSTSSLIMGGGTFNYSNSGASQTVNGLTVRAGYSTVNNTASGQTLTLGSITRATSIYGMVNFANLTGPISTTTGNVDSIIGPWATTGSATTLRYAVGSADGSTPTNVSAITGTTATANTLANVTSDTTNYEYSAAVSAMGAGVNLTANTLRYNGAATTTAINATSTLKLNGLMHAGTNTLTISGGPSTGGLVIGSTNELVIAANTSATTISAVIADGGSAGRLIYGGGGTLTLSGLNTFSGGLVINSGIVTTGAAASVSSGGTGTGAITVNSAGRLTLSTGVGTLNRALTLNGGSLFFAGSGNDLTLAGTLEFAANSTLDATNNNSGFPTITASTSGTGGFTKTGIGGIRLNGTSNTYSGPTIVNAGGVTVKSSLYGNVTTNWTPANITVASGATFMMNVGGSGEFTIGQAATMISNLSSNVNNNGLQAGSFVGVDTRNATPGTYVYSANITDSTGAGGGSISFKHTGAGG